MNDSCVSGEKEKGMEPTRGQAEAMHDDYVIRNWWNGEKEKYEEEQREANRVV